jgi:hypothetical protein
MNSFSNAMNQLMLHFPDPFDMDPRVVKEKPNAKTLFILEHQLVRKKMDKVLSVLQKLLKKDLSREELQKIQKKWRELKILKYYIQRFERPNVLSTNKDMRAFFLLKQLIMEYEFFLKLIQKTFT